MANTAATAAVQGAAAAHTPSNNERKVPVFSNKPGEDWVSWRLTFSNIANYKKWDDEKKKEIIKASMTGYAVQAVANIILDEIPPVPEIKADPARGIPARPAVPGRPRLTAEEMLDAYEAKFVTRSGTVEARQEFLDAKQKSDEGLTAWHTRLISLYRRSDPYNDLDRSKELIERFIRGLNNDKIAERLFYDTPTTMNEALDIAARQNAALISVEEMHGGRRNRRGLYAFGHKEDDKEKPKMSTIRCWNCEQEGHVKRECPKLPKKGQSGKGKPRGPRRFNRDRNSKKLTRIQALNMADEEGGFREEDEEAEN